MSKYRPWEFATTYLVHLDIIVDVSTTSAHWGCVSFCPSIHMKPVYGLKNQLFCQKSVMRCIQFDGAGHTNGGVTTNCQSLLLGLRVLDLSWLECSAPSLQDIYCKFHKFLGSLSSISFSFINVVLQFPLVAYVAFLVSKSIVAHGFFILLQMDSDVHKVTG